jgi:hypothetical protein
MFRTKGRRVEKERLINWEEADGGLGDSFVPSYTIVGL